MLLSPLPFDYIQLIDAGDRRRRAQSRPTGVRVRRTSPKSKS
jgi:hypothetical protein